MTWKPHLVTCQKCGVEYRASGFKGRPPKYCPSCAGEARKARKDEIKANGWCVDCGRAARPGRVRCAECAARQSAYAEEDDGADQDDADQDDEPKEATILYDPKTMQIEE